MSLRPFVHRSGWLVKILPRIRNSEIETKGRKNCGELSPLPFFLNLSISIERLMNVQKCIHIKENMKRGNVVVSGATQIRSTLQ
jgi:hypothetical protein